MSLQIIDLVASQETYVDQTAEILWRAFKDRSPAWPTISAARREVLDSLAPERVSRVMIHDTAGVVGWIGGIPQYDGHVWELHPLVVAENWRRRGIGRALVSDLERIIARRGALTLWAGSDDENFETSLSGVDLYDDLPSRLRRCVLGASIRSDSTCDSVSHRRRDAGCQRPRKPDIYLARGSDRTWFLAFKGDRSVA